MAVDTVIGCLASIVKVFAIDYNIQFVIYVVIFSCTWYLVLVYAFLLGWLGLYLFSLAVFRVQLKKTKHEAIGLVTVLVTPLTFLWVLPWKTRSGILCHYAFSLNDIQFLFFYNIPTFSSVLLTGFFIGAVLITLCKNAVNGAENTLQQQHRKAVRETIPFVVFMIVHEITLIMVMVIFSIQLYLAKEEKKAGTLFYGNAIICGH